MTGAVRIGARGGAGGLLVELPGAVGDTPPVEAASVAGALVASIVRLPTNVLRALTRKAQPLS